MAKRVAAMLPLLEQTLDAFGRARRTPANAAVEQVAPPAVSIGAASAASRSAANLAEWQSTHRGNSRALLQVRLSRMSLAVGGLVVAAIGIDFVLGLPFGTPRIFGDELIYWEMGRSFAWTGHFAVRGAANPGYGVGYPALLSVLQRLSSTQAQAYAVAGSSIRRLLLAAVPVYCLATRVLPRRSALAAAAFTVLVPSVVYTSTIMTENVFYPALLLGVLMIVRALERPTALRQLGLLAVIGVTCTVKAQAVVVLPAYLLAAVLLAVLEQRDGMGKALRRVLYELRPILAVVVAGAAGVVAEAIARGGRHLPSSVPIASS